jgi:hypothetical protein
MTSTARSAAGTDHTGSQGVRSAPPREGSRSLLCRAGAATAESDTR